MWDPFPEIRISALAICNLQYTIRYPICFSLISGTMTRRCSHCSHNGHNSRTCPNRGVKIFGVRLTDGLIRKSASMGNLSHYAGSTSGHHQNGVSGNNSVSPGETPEHGAAADGYASEGFVPGSSSSRERKKGLNISFFYILVWFIDWWVSIFVFQIFNLFGIICSCCFGDFTGLCFS